MSEGKKHDGMNGEGEMKLRYDLLDVYAIEGLVKIITHGAKKYGDNNWRLVTNAKDRYYAAAMRHLAEIRKGVLRDDETGEFHIDHAQTNLMFLSAIQHDEHNAAREEAAKCEYATNVAEFVAAVEKEDAEADPVAIWDEWWSKIRPAGKCEHPGLAYCRPVK